MSSPAPPTQSVRIGAAVEDVIARAAVQQVPARFAEQTIVARAAEQRIVAGAAEQTIVAAASEQAVIARAAEQLVVAGAAVQQIIAFVAEDGVVARPAEQMVVEGRAVDHVVPVGPGDELPDSALGLRAIHIRGGAGPEIIQPVGWRAEAKADAHAGHDHRAAIGAGRGCPAGGISVPPGVPGARAAGAAPWLAASGSKISPPVDAVVWPASAPCAAGPSLAAARS